nr:hypothetical protein [uncultured Mediterranean phage uvMED]
MAKTAQAVIETKVKDGASAGFHKFRNEMKKTEKQGKVLNQQFRFMRGGMGQVGHQFQDIAVQAQMGTNAMIIFGQQGSQIASLFGPQGAMIGALIAVGAALSMALMPRLFGATQAAKDLKSTMKSLADDFDNLTEAQKALVRTQVEKQIEDNNALLREQQRELNDLKAITLSFNRIFFGGSNEQQKQRIQELGASIDVLKQSNIDLKASIDDTSEFFTKQEDALQTQIDTFGKSAHAIRVYGIEADVTAGKLKRKEADELIAQSLTLEGLRKAAEEKKRIQANEDERAKRMRDERTKAENKAVKDRLDEQKKRIADMEKEGSEHYAKLEESARRFSDTIGDGFVDAINGSKSFTEAFKATAKSVIDDLTRMIIKKQITDQIFGIALDYIARTSIDAPTPDFKDPSPNISIPELDIPINVPQKLPDIETDSIYNVPSAESYNGGGFTGYGSRAGGIDGKGGFPAILHPNESVIDHTRGQGMGTVVNQTINISTGVQQTVRAEITNLMPQIQEATKSAVADARARGGSYSKALLGA